jgi:hypothetical protein
MVWLLSSVYMIRSQSELQLRFHPGLGLTMTISFKLVASLGFQCTDITGITLEHRPL